MRSSSDLNRAGADLFLKGDRLGARLHYVAALRTEPNMAFALANLATVESQDQNLEASACLLRRLLAQTPRDGTQWGNLGANLMQLGRYDEARVTLEKAAELAPDNPNVWHNLALLALRLGNFADGEEFLNKVDALAPGRKQVASDRAHLMLGRGTDLKAAFAQFEWRWHELLHLPPWDFYIPEWHGQDLSGKHILLHAEQGFGDTIMCARFAKDLVQRGSRVTLAVQSGLVDLFAEQKWTGVGVIDVHAFTPELCPGVDFHTPMFSAMRWLEVEQRDISPEPYLRCKTALGPPHCANALNVGICWASGQRNNKYDWRRRVSNLESWLQLAELPHVRLWSLQVGAGSEDIERIGATGLVGDETRKFASFHDTAKFISGLDLVIAVDTAVAHLAGALGKPTWMLSPHTRCWRWWNAAHGSGRPWYKSMAILSQPSPHDWNTPLRQVRRWLEEGIDVERLAA